MFEKLFTGPNLLLLAVMAWAAFMVRSAAVRSQRSRGRDVEKELQSELRAKQRSAEGQLHHLEVRLHDYDRDVSARVQTTMTMLDQLIAEADQEIVRLETLLEDGQAKPASRLTAEQRRMVVHLAGAGYSMVEIARLTERSVDVIAQVFKEDGNRDRKAA